MLALNRLPHPRGLPLIGNSLQIKPSRAYQKLCEWADRYGALYTFRIGLRRILVISDPDIICELLRERPGKFRRWKKMEELGLEVGADGVFVAEGDKWRRHRELIVPTFNNQHVKQFWGRLEAVTDRLEQRWSRLADTGESVDIRKDSMRYTVDVVTGFAFGNDLNTLNDSDNTLQGHLSKFLQTAARRQAAIFPYWRYIKLPWDREFDVALAQIKQIVNELIEQARYRIANDPELAANPTNLVEALVAYQNKDTCSSLTDGEIVGNVLTFLLAGEDTTANTIAWTMYYMAMHPEIQGEMQREADAVIGNGSRVHDIKQVEELPYINAVIQESMRLKPVFPLLTLEPNQDVEIAGIEVIKGTPLFLLPGNLGRQDSCFIDANDFIPRRWLGDSRFSNDNTKAFMPFGSGPRFCPGHRLAKLECVMAISTLVKNYTVINDLAAAPTHETYAFTLCPSQVVVKLGKR